LEDKVVTNDFLVIESFELIDLHLLAFHKVECGDALNANILLSIIPRDNNTFQH